MIKTKMLEKESKLNIPLLSVRIIIVLMSLALLIVGGFILYESIMATDYKASKIWVGTIMLLCGFSTTTYNLVKLANMEKYQAGSIFY